MKKKESFAGLEITAEGEENRFGRFAAAIALAIAALALLLFILPAARESLCALLNRLFEASQAANTYVYQLYETTDGASPALALILIGAAAAALLALSAVKRQVWIPMLMALALAAGEMWLGVVPGVWVNIAAFGLLAAFCFYFGEGWRSTAAFAAAAAAAVILTLAFRPGVDLRLEERSERVRDSLSVLESRISQGLSGGSAEQEATRKENRLNMENGNADGDYRGYEHITENETEISRPKRTNYFKTALLGLLILALLTLPFLPFVLFDANRRQAAARRADFDSDDASTAICAVFRHIAAYLESTGKAGGIGSFSSWADRLGHDMPDGYAEKYRLAADIFREAAYSTHIMTKEQVEQVKALLEETETALYDGGDMRTRLRLKYVLGLHL